MKQMLCVLFVVVFFFFFLIIAEKNWEKQEVPLGGRKEVAFGVSWAWVRIPALPLTVYVLGGRLHNANKPRFLPL